MVINDTTINTFDDNILPDLLFVKISHAPKPPIPIHSILVATTRSLIFS